MEKDFFNLYADQENLALEVGHNSTTDWCITIYDKKGLKLCEYKDAVVTVQDRDRGLAFVRAYALLCEYLCENRGGY